MKILVTGVGGPAGGIVSHLLLRQGYEVIGCDMRPVLFPELKDVRQCPPATNHDYVSWLATAAATADFLIPTVQEELPLVAEARAFIPCPVLISPLAGVQVAQDKYETARMLAQAGLPVPRFALPSVLADVAVVGRQIGWPCLSKPRLGRGGRGVVLYDSPADFAALTGLDDTAIVQEFAPGREYTVNLCLTGLNGHSRATVVVLEKLALREGRTGNAAAVQRVCDPQIADLAVAAAKTVGLSGPLDMDIRRRADGTPLILEINARFGANIAHAPEVFAAALDAMREA